MANPLRQLLVFRLAQQRYGIDLLAVREIGKASRITPVFSAPAYVRGVTNLRGEIVTILDLAQRLDLASAPAPEAHQVYVETRGETVGLLVDEVEDVVHVAAEKLVPPPAPANEGVDRFINSVLFRPEDMVTVLDVNALLEE